jgi:TonB family protein
MRKTHKMHDSSGGRLLRPVLLFFMMLALLASDGSRPPAAAGSDEERNIEGFAVKRVQPAYPPLAQKYKIEGAVVVHVTVVKDGTVSKAEFVRGNNVFRSVSLDAAKRWEFRKPDNTLAGTIQFRFKLN